MRNWGRERPRHIVCNQQGVHIQGVFGKPSGRQTPPKHFLYIWEVASLSGLLRPLGHSEVALHRLGEQHCQCLSNSGESLSKNTAEASARAHDVLSLRVAGERRGESCWQSLCPLREISNDGANKGVAD